jgi:transposase
MNVQRLKDEKGRLREIEEEVRKRSSGNQDISNISDIRGMGEMNASTIVSEIGDIKQFSSSVKLQAYGGKVPDISGSGGSTHATGVTRIRNPHLSNAIYESAVSLVANRSPAFKEIFTRGDQEGKETNSGIHSGGEETPISRIFDYEES